MRWTLGGSVGHELRGALTACGIEEVAVVNWRKECTLDVYKLVLGAFVIVSPWLFAFTYSPARLDAWGSGLLVMGLSAAAMVAFVDWEEWFALVVGEKADVYVFFRDPPRVSSSNRKSRCAPVTSRFVKAEITTVLEEHESR